MREINNGDKSSALPSNDHSTFEGKARADQCPELTHYKVETACISDIFSNSNNDDHDLLEKLIVSEGVTKIKRDFIVSEDEGFRLGGGGGGGRKGEVVTFSRKSRRNLMIKLAEMKSPFEFWQDFTFADDIMQGLRIKERAKLSAKVLKAFKLWLEREGYKIQGVWKREWRPRLSGIIIGQYVPHYHFLYSIEGISKEEYFKLALLLARKWVDFTGTNECEKALRVALHPKSYRLIESRKQANVYVSDRKYISKYGEYISEESIGRNWGYIGNPEFAENETFYMNQSEMVLLRRILKKFVRKNKTRFRRMIVKKYSRFFVFIDRSTVHRILEWIVKNRMIRAVEGVPF
jgi:hypothetical protein